MELNEKWDIQAVAPIAKIEVRSGEKSNNGLHLHSFKSEPERLSESSANIIIPSVANADNQSDISKIEYG